MHQLIEFFLVSFAAVTLSWTFRGRIGMMIIPFITAGYLLYKSPLSLLLLLTIVFANYFILSKSKFSQKIQILLCLTLTGGILLFAKIKLSLSDGWVIPLGLSYYAFRNIHFALECYKGKIRQFTFLEYLSYNLFIPVMLVGPINQYQLFIKDWQRRRYDENNISYGLERILYGFTKIILIGNFLISRKLSLYAESLHDQHLWLYTFLGLCVFVFNAYFQFAGYSDIAIGLSRLAGIRINENFNYPFLSVNMREFWTRYHMSLSQFCKDYVYTPIASYFRNPILGVVLTMAIIGLWHELSWRYLVWGLIQFAGITYSGILPVGDSSLLKNISRVGTGLFYILSCVIISKTSFEEVLIVYKILFFLN
jgi:alginate O-acetyltransferase complex protein AlgI